MQELVPVQFHGDTLWAISDGDQVFVSVREVCDLIGLTFQGQMEKLEEAAWATIRSSMLVARDGKVREQKMIDAESLPYWLVTIQTGRVACPEIRGKIVRMQMEAKDVLARHFKLARLDSIRPDDKFGQEAVAILNERSKVLRTIAAETEKLRHLEQSFGAVLGTQPREQQAVAALPAPVVIVEPEDEWPPFMTAQGYARTIGVHNLTDGQLSLIGRKLAAFSREHDHPMGEQKRIDGPVKTYLTREVLMVHEDQFRNPPQPASKKPAAEAA